jgi:hypothetical protein
MTDSNKLALILASKSPAHVKTILEVRERYKSLMELTKNEILDLQGKALAIGYRNGECRKRMNTPSYYENNEGKTVETYFRYINRVR